jgi:hypothetical protein
MYCSFNTKIIPWNCFLKVPDSDGTRKVARKT